MAQMDEHSPLRGEIYKVCDVSCRCAAVVVPTQTKCYKHLNVAQGVNHATRQRGASCNQRYVVNVRNPQRPPNVNEGHVVNVMK